MSDLKTAASSETLKEFVQTYFVHNPHLINLYKASDAMGHSGEVFEVLAKIRSNPPKADEKITHPLQRIIDRKCAQGMLPGFPAEYEVIDATSTEHNAILLVSDHVLSDLKKSFIQGTFIGAAEIRLRDVVNFRGPNAPRILICFDHQKMAAKHHNEQEIVQAIEINQWHYLLPYAATGIEQGKILSMFEKRTATTH
jgi:hypothetical protein